jgi:hypothetical protein
MDAAASAVIPNADGHSRRHAGSDLVRLYRPRGADALMCRNPEGFARLRHPNISWRESLKILEECDCLLTVSAQWRLVRAAPGYSLFALDVCAQGTIERWIANTDMVPVD